MNERIRELYQQAHSIRHYDGDPMREGNPPTVYWQGEKSAEKFAELIVRECAVIGNTAYSDVGNYTYYTYIGDKIKQHFGVDSA
jgi:hypothetical protein